MQVFKASIIILVVVIFVVSLVLADVPQMVTYQGQIANFEGSPLDSTVSMTYVIYDDKIEKLEARINELETDRE